MIINKQLRDAAKAKIHKDKLPRSYSPWYVAYTWTSENPKFVFGPYVVGFDNLDKADDFDEEMRKCGRESVMLDEYPFELGIL